MSEQTIQPNTAEFYRAETAYFKAKCRPRWFYNSLNNRHRPYVRPRKGNEIDGKLNIKRAKKERVRQLKALKNI